MTLEGVDLTHTIQLKYTSLYRGISWGELQIGSKNILGLLGNLFKDP